MDSGTRTSRRSAFCKVCGSVEKLRVSGMLGQHHLWIGNEYIGVCPGTGMDPEATTSALLFKAVDAKRRAEKRV